MLPRLQARTVACVEKAPRGVNFHPYLWPAYRKRLIHSDKPILVGPFLGEAGIEALYQLSFVEKLKQLGVKPERIIPIGRGGSAVWYQCPTGVEVFAMRTPQQVRVENAVRRMRRGLIKQIEMTAFDRQIITDTAKSLGLKKYHVLHPLWMYRTLEPYWMGQRGLDWLHARTTYTHMPPPALPEGVTLPPEFVTVKFYFRATFEYKHDAIMLAKATVQKLAAQWPVIVLNTGIHADDHLDWTPKKHPNVTLLSDLMPLTPENTLAMQSAVIGRSLGFVGTYGGLAQVAQRLGRAAVTFYTSWGYTSLSHKHLSDAVAIRTGVPFLVHQVKELALMNVTLPIGAPAEKNPLQSEAAMVK